jgi:HEAT repeat protein
MGFFKSLFGPPDIEALKAARDTAALRKAISNQDWKVRRAVVEALGELKDGQSVDALAHVLASDSYVPVRETAAEALGRIGDRRGVSHLVAAVTGKSLDGSIHISVTSEDSFKELRRRAATALGILGDKAAVDPLLDVLLDDPDEAVRRAAAAALGTLCDARAVGALQLALVSEAIPRADAESALNQIGQHFASRDPHESVLALLTDTNDTLRFAAVRALSRSNYVQALEPIANMVGDISTNATAVAAFALARMRDQRAIEPLTNILKRWQRLVDLDRSPLAKMALNGGIAKVVLGAPGDLRAEGARLLADLMPSETQAVLKLVAIYSESVEGFVRGQGGPQEQELRAIGQNLYDRGGIELMRTVHARFSSQCNAPGAARNLEHMWDGIGAWQG